MGWVFTPFVEFRVASNIVRVPAGGILGRSTQAALRLPYPEVSEAHALLTYREKRFQLLALRGELLVDGRSVSEVPLHEGLVVELARSLTLSVVHLFEPDASLMLSVDEVPCLLPDMPCSLIPLQRAAPRYVLQALGDLALVRGAQEGEGLVFYDDEHGLAIHEGDGPLKRVALPFVQVFRGRSLRLLAVPHSGTESTSRAGRAHEQVRLRVSVRFESVHIWGVAREPTVLSGVTARIVSELVLMGGGPVGWDVVAGEVWPSKSSHRAGLRDNWDKALQRMRRQLRAGGIRDDLVRVDRHGNIELLLYDGDSFSNDTGEQ